jgi:beta-lactamase superfamily II metal-dependent hydrolase
MHRTITLAAALLCAAATSAAAQPRTTLDIYVVDVEGGNATLFVAPSGQSVLIDTGNFAPAAAKRDADRIMAAARDARLTQIDHLITTHWHGDHLGGTVELAAQIPIRNYIDHGPSVQDQPANVDFLREVYPRLVAAAKRTIVKPGDTIPLTGLDWRIVSSAGEVLRTNLPGAGAANTYCANRQPPERDQTENAQSVGSIVSFGRFRVAMLGDLTSDREFDLMCPANRIGTVDLNIVSHHGQPVSNAEVLVHALAPRVHIMNNGTRKGGQPDAMKVLHTSPGLEDFWQIHFSLLSGQEYTQPGMFIANLVDEQPEAMPLAPYTPPPQNAPPAPVHNGPAYWFKVQAKQDGSFTVTNQRNGFTKSYAAR